MHELMTKSSPKSATDSFNAGSTINDHDLKQNVIGSFCHLIEIRSTRYSRIHNAMPKEYFG